MANINITTHPTTLTSATPATLTDKTFDPAKWIAELEENGGGYVLTPEGCLQIVQNYEGTTKEQQEAVRAHIFGTDANQKEKIRAYLIGCQTEGSTTAWTAAVADYRLSKQKLDRHNEERSVAPCGSPEANADEGKTARLADAHSEAMNCLLLMPAPDLEALRLKLDIFDTELLADGWNNGGEISAAIARDARNLIVVHKEAA